MKRFSAILFSFIFLFNLYGYRLFFDYMQEKENAVLEAHIENTLTEEELISLKVPANLPPYTTSSTEYEWVNGEVIIDGVFYKYVKRKIINDSIEFLCIKNSGKTNVENAREEFFRLANDLESADQAGKKTPAAVQAKPAFPEFCSFIEPFILPQCVETQPLPYPFCLSFKPTKSGMVEEQPPEVIAV